VIWRERSPLCRIDSLRRSLLPPSVAGIVALCPSVSLTRVTGIGESVPCGVALAAEPAADSPDWFVWSVEQNVAIDADREFVADRTLIVG